MRCIVIDDEPLARQGMELLITEIPDLEHLGSFATIIEADNFLQETNTDIIFLDIHIPGINGFEYLKMNRHPAMVVITTAFPQYALESYEYDVIDYLTKPIRLERFFKTVKKCSELHEKRKNEDVIVKENEYFFIRANKKYVRINIKDVMYIEGEKDYSKIVCGKENFLVAFNLKNLESNLKIPNFIRVNKSYIVNRDFVKSFDSNYVDVGIFHIPIGDSFKEDLVDKLSNNRVIKKP